ncbi:hypothetical protein M404DRAFT_498781 [Pisolithus tinctorius Marx 270]|uniref:Uncharacterized protein n=1 Tax=Pisolithus tinctorius Marx 270 TaxID=870435 RepID=A0A0C3NZC6_PISTI|nr:hypothetical protein M404DRAFT_498781 [Pisolithus tinctorius Marx 270]
MRNTIHAGYIDLWGTARPFSSEAPTSFWVFPHRKAVTVRLTGVVPQHETLLQNRMFYTHVHRVEYNQVSKTLCCSKAKGKAVQQSSNHTEMQLHSFRLNLLVV